MELSTFSSLLSFAVEIEERSVRFYEEAADSGVCGHRNETILVLARQGRNRRLLLLAARQENVTEMILEPITGLDSKWYEVDYRQFVECAGWLAMAAEVERNSLRFYLDAGDRAKHLLAGVARTFARLARENEQRLQEIQHLAGLSR
jgi:rubrerythrin